MHNLHRLPSHPDVLIAFLENLLLTTGQVEYFLDSVLCLYVSLCLYSSSIVNQVSLCI